MEQIEYENLYQGLFKEAGLSSARSNVNKLLSNAVTTIKKIDKNPGMGSDNMQRLFAKNVVSKLRPSTIRFGLKHPKAGMNTGKHMIKKVKKLHDSKLVKGVGPKIEKQIMSEGVAPKPILENYVKKRFGKYEKGLDNLTNKYNFAI